MVVMNNESLSVSVVRYYILSAINLIVQTERLSDGTRKVVNIAEVYEGKDKPRIEPIFIFQRQDTLPDGTIVGYHTAAGFVPACMERLRAFGQEIPPHIFQVKEDRNG
jgi:pilus assembly protein CpaF